MEQYRILGSIISVLISTYSLSCRLAAILLSDSWSASRSIILLIGLSHFSDTHKLGQMCYNTSPARSAPTRPQDNR
jgi:hypothetical protein